MEELLLQMNDGQIVNNLDSYEFAITESLKKYNYVVDENNYAQAKDDRARLNESLEKCKRERIDFEKSMLNEWDPIKKRLMTIEKNIKKSIDVLGSSINECDEKEKAIKKDEIANTYAQYDISKSIPLERIFESSWLNKTCSNKKWNEELEKKVKKIKQDIDMIKCFQPSDIGDARQVQIFYIETLDIGLTKAKSDELIANRKKVQEEERLRLEQEQLAAQKQIEMEHVAPEIERVDFKQELEEAAAVEQLMVRAFKVQATREQIIELVDYMKSHEIKFWKMEVK